MKVGDIVRFPHREWTTTPGNKTCSLRTEKIGLVLEYHTWEKIVTILYEEKIYRIRANDVQLHARH